MSCQPATTHSTALCGYEYWIRVCVCMYVWLCVTRIIFVFSFCCNIVATFLVFCLFLLFLHANIFTIFTCLCSEHARIFTHSTVVCQKHLGLVQFFRCVLQLNMRDMASGARNISVGYFSSSRMVHKHTHKHINHWYEYFWWLKCIFMMYDVERNCMQVMRV